MSLLHLGKNLQLTSRLPFPETTKMMIKKTLKRKNPNDPDPDQIHEDVGLGQVIVEIHGVAVVGEHPGVPVGVPHEAHLQDGRPGNLHRYRKKSVSTN